MRVGSSQEPVRVDLRSRRNKSFWTIKRAVKSKSMIKNKNSRKREVKVLIVRKSKIRILIGIDQR